MTVAIAAVAITSDRRETHAYLQDVAAASGLPVMLYNNPVAYGTDLTPEDFARLADNPRFEAIKESAADTRRFTRIRRVSRGSAPASSLRGTAWAGTRCGGHCSRRSRRRERLRIVSHRSWARSRP